MEAAASVLVWSPDRRPAEVLSDWIRFYRRSLPFADRFVAVGFDRATADPGSVLSQVNQRFGLSLRSDWEATTHQASVWADVEERARRYDGDVYETRVARPSNSDLRRRRRDIARNALAASELAALRTSADDLYSQYQSLMDAVDDPFDRGHR